MLHGLPKNRNRIYDNAVGYWGTALQVLKVIEEMSELTKALIKGYLLDHSTAEVKPKLQTASIIDEVADVFIMLEQLIHIIGPEQIAHRVHQKLERLATYIRDHQIEGFTGVKLDDEETLSLADNTFTLLNKAYALLRRIEDGDQGKYCPECGGEKSEQGIQHARTCELKVLTEEFERKLGVEHD